MHAEMKPCLQGLMKLCRLKDISLLLFLLLLSLTLLLTLSLCLGREKHGQLWWVPSSSLVEGDWTPPFFPGHSHELRPAVFLQLFYLFQTHWQWQKVGMALFKDAINNILQNQGKFPRAIPFMPMEYPVSLLSSFSHKKMGIQAGIVFVGFFCLTGNISSVLPSYFTGLLQLMHPVTIKAIRSRDKRLCFMLITK